MPENRLAEYLNIVSVLSRNIREYYAQEEGVNTLQLDKRMRKILSKACESSEAGVKQKQQKQTSNKLRSMNCVSDLLKKSENCKNRDHQRQKILLKLIILLEQQLSIIKTNELAELHKNQRLFCKPALPELNTAEVAQPNSEYKTPKKAKLSKQYFKPKQYYPKNLYASPYESVNSFKNYIKSPQKTQYVSNPNPEEELLLEEKNLYRAEGYRGSEYRASGYRGQDYRAQGYGGSEYRAQGYRGPDQRAQGSRSNNYYGYQSRNSYGDMNPYSYGYGKSRFNVDQPINRQDLSFNSQQDDALDINQSEIQVNNALDSIFIKESRLNPNSIQTYSQFEQYEQSIKQALGKTKRLQQFIAKQMNKQDFIPLTTSQE